LQAATHAAATLHVNVNKKGLDPAITHYTAPKAAQPHAIHAGPAASAWLHSGPPFAGGVEELADTGAAKHGGKDEVLVMVFSFPHVLTK
jgi:hypothetical protein